MNSKGTMQAGFTGRILPAILLFAGFCLPTLVGSCAYAAFEDLGAGARGPGMGNAMASVADDVYAAHYNPAGLGIITRPQFTASYTQLFAGLSDESSLGTSFLAYAYPIKDGKKGTVTGALNSFSLSSLYRENTLYLSYGRLVYTRSGGDELFLGTTLKYLHSSFGNFSESVNATIGAVVTDQADPVLSGKSSHNAFDADFGALYRFKTHYQLGLQVARILQPDMAFSSGDSDPLPMAVKLGFNYKSLISNLAAQIETKGAPDGSIDNIFTAAAERWFPKAFIGDFAIRGAMGLGTREFKQVSLGLSYRNRRLQMDYGFVLPLQTIAATAGTHRMAMTFRFGKPTEQEETLETLMEALRNLNLPPSEEVAKDTAPVTTTPDELDIPEKLAQAEAAVKAGRYREAVSLTTLVVDSAPQNAAAWQTMGIAYLGMEKYKNSLYAWNKAQQYEKSPALKEAIKGYIKSISRLERSSQRLKMKYSQPAGISSLSQEDIDSMLNRGVDYYVNQEFDKARELFEKILKLEPGNVEALKSLRRLKDEKRR